MKELSSGIPFDYKQKYPELFTLEYRDRMMNQPMSDPNQGIITVNISTTPFINLKRYG